MSPPTVNGCNFVTSAINSVLGCSGSCTFRGRGMHMPFVVLLFSCFSRFLIQKIQFTAPIYIESHWVPGDVHDAFRRPHVRVVRRRLCSHHTPVFYCCNSLSNDARFRREDLHVKVCPWCGVGLLRLFFLYCGVINKLTLLLVLAAPVKRKGARGEVRFPETLLLCALFYLKGPAPCCY